MMSAETRLKDGAAEARREVEARMSAALARCEQPDLRVAMLHLIRAGGKRLRAVVPWMVTSAMGGPAEAALDVGASIELIHNFTLIHDDIMDDDLVRRGQPSVHAIHGVPTAINAGDAMFAIAFEALAVSPHVSGHLIGRLTEQLGAMVRRVAEGQQIDIGFEDRDDVDSKEYRRMIAGKTAAVFEVAARCGALLATDDEAMIVRMARWGLDVGLTFQVMDDLLDLTADADALGKPLGSDLVQGKRTLIVMHALAQPDGPARRALLAALGNGGSASEDTLAAGIAALHELGSITAVREEAERLHADARQALSALPESDALALLIDLTDYQLERHH